MLLQVKYDYTLAEQMSFPCVKEGASVDELGLGQCFPFGVEFQKRRNGKLTVFIDDWVTLPIVVHDKEFVTHVITP